MSDEQRPASWAAVTEGSPFTLANLPLGVADVDGQASALIAVGDQAVVLRSCADAGLLDSVGITYGAYSQDSLNDLLAHGPAAITALRSRIRALLTDESLGLTDIDALRAQATLTLRRTVDIGDYVDFYSSLHHATNLGRLFRPDAEPLLPNWRRLPVSYHGRAGTVVVSGHPIVRPKGLTAAGEQLAYRPTESLDIELELGAVIGVGSELGVPIPAADAASHVAGLVLLNDWSARDIQAFEYQPLGPHLGKSFATTVSPWLVTLDALAPFRTSPPEQDPRPDDYLLGAADWAFDIELDVLLQSHAMRAAGLAAVSVSRTNFADMYWTVAQQLAHLTANGASTRTGDLLGSGTVSGPTRGSEGSLIELTRRGAEPLRLPTGEQRAFLEDGDTVILRGVCRRPDGSVALGFGDCVGTVLPAKEVG
jgi:fumarylacetoacetase